MEITAKQQGNNLTYKFPKSSSGTCQKPRGKHSLVYVVIPIYTYIINNERINDWDGKQIKINVSFLVQVKNKPGSAGRIVWNLND